MQQTAERERERGGQGEEEERSKTKEEIVFSAERVITTRRHRLALVKTQPNRFAGDSTRCLRPRRIAHSFSIMAAGN